MKQLFTAALVFLAAPLCFAALLELEAGPASIENVNLARKATLKMDGHEHDLAFLGAGLRTKRVVIANVKVYVAQAFGDVQRFVRDEGGALGSLETMPALAMQLTFLRGVDAPTVQNSFREALVANGVDLNRTDIAEFLKAVTQGGDAHAGRSMSLVGVRNGGEELVTYEGTNGSPVTVRGTSGFIRSVFSIWYGTPSDNGVAALKRELLMRREGY